MLGEYDDCLGGVKQAEWMHSSRIKLSLCQPVVAWRVQRGTLSTAPVLRTFDFLNRNADLGSLLLRRGERGVKQLTSAVGPRTLAPHVQVKQVRHWFGDVKQFLPIDRFLLALSPGVPVGEAPDGHFRDEVDHGNHPSVRGHAHDTAKKVVTGVIAGRTPVFNQNFVHEIHGIRLSPLGVVEEPKLRIIYDLTFARSGCMCLS